MFRYNVYTVYIYIMTIKFVSLVKHYTMWPRLTLLVFYLGSYSQIKCYLFRVFLWTFLFYSSCIFKLKKNTRFSQHTKRNCFLIFKHNQFKFLRSYFGWYIRHLIACNCAVYIHPGILHYKTSLHCYNT